MEIKLDLRIGLTPKHTTGHKEEGRVPIRLPPMGSFGVTPIGTMLD